MKDSILYIGDFVLPDCDASAVRVRGIADALSEAGFSVDLIGNDSKRGLANAKLGTRDIPRVAARLVDLLLTADSFMRQLNHVDWSRTAAVICYPGPAALVWRMLHACRRHRVPLILDLVEWFDPSHTPLGSFGPFALDSELRMRWLNQRAGNLICISSFLERYYAAKGCRVLRVPTLIGWRADPTPPKSNYDASSRRLTLVYAGSPGRKELFSEIVGGVQAARKRGIDVVFRVVGVTEPQLALYFARLGRGFDLDGVECYGRVPRERALEIVESSDFSVIVRPQERFANAGFPTKFVESLSLGVPVMANDTSDIGDYLRDGRDGYLLEQPTAAAVERAILRAVQLAPEEKTRMRGTALARASECFDYRHYASALADFVGAARVCT
jgi:glycosyltransferase involved in cell wall biosynthesis